MLPARLLGCLSLELVKFSPWGRVSAPADVAPEALEEWKHSSKGYERSVYMVGWVAGPLSVRFSRPRHYFSWHRHSASKATFAPCEPIQTAHRACKEACSTRGIPQPGGSRFIRGYGLSRNRARSPRALARVRAIRGTLVLLPRPSVCLSARRRGEASHATLARAASHECFGELLVGGSS